MKYTVKVMHIRKAIEFIDVRTNEVCFPSDKEELMWAIFGTPDYIVEKENECWHHIDSISANTKKEIKKIFNQKFEEQYSCVFSTNNNLVYDTIELHYV